MTTGLYFQSLEKWTPDRDEAYDFGLIARATKFAHKARIPGLELILSLDGSEQDTAVPFETFFLGCPPRRARHNGHRKCRLA